MDRNTLLAIVLSTVFLLAWFGLVLPRVQPPSAPLSVLPTQPASFPRSPSSVSTPPLTSEGSASVPPPSVPNVILETPQHRVEFVAAGAAVSHWILKSRKEQLDLVAAGTILGTWPNVTFNVTEHEAHRVVWAADLPTGVHVIKTYEVTPGGHLHHLSIALSNPQSTAVAVDDLRLSLGPGLGTSANEEKENPGLIRALSFGDHQFRVHKPGLYPEPAQWVALDNRYFLAALIHASADGRSPAGEPWTFVVEGQKAETRTYITQPCRLGPGETHTVTWQVYLGPKGYTRLSRLGLRLEESVDFGMMGGLGKAALHALYFLHRLTGNYGWAIILLTVGLQILLFPLTIKSLKASLAMKALQPQIKVLQDRFKGDPKRLNVEMMHLYKQGGTNPLGGCLPMLLQLPIFWALFTTLRNAYELRGAPFIGWIRDLSAQDPYYVLPILMGLGMFGQQRMTSVAADPTQRQMMYIMPVIFTFMFLRFPAGLVLYWLVNNVLTIIEQWGFQRWRQSR